MSISGRTAVEIILLGGLGVAGAVAAILFVSAKQQPDDIRRVSMPDDRRWQAVAPGRVEAWSGEIRLGAAAPGMIGEVLVKAGDRVVAEEPLVQLRDDELKARLAVAEAQAALRRRARNDQSASGRSSERRRAEDALFDAERAAAEARAAFDGVAAEKRSGARPDADLYGASAALTQARDRLRQRRSELRKLVADKDTPLPTAIEGELTVARNELLAAEAAVEKLTVRAPITGSILQVNAKTGELAAPSSPQPLVLLGDISALRVRAELDERDRGEIALGQAASVRAAAFPGRDFSGKVSFVAPLVAPGRVSSRGARGLTDIDVAEVVVDLSDAGPLAVGMKVDVYFYRDRAAEAQPALRR